MVLRIMVFLVVLLNLHCQTVIAEELHELFSVTEKTRCPVCGMAVAGHRQWLAEVRLSDGTMAAFDGVKDMAAYTLAPDRYGAAKSVTVNEIVVKDYYSLAWIDGRTAWYVLGSDVLGPMGHELIPFAKKTEAETFLRDHHGTRILGFSEIDRALLDSLQQGHKMKGHGAMHQ